MGSILIRIIDSIGRVGFSRRHREHGRLGDDLIGHLCCFMAARANWKGVLNMGEVSCPVAFFTAASTAERIAFHILNRKLSPIRDCRTRARPLLGAD